LNTKIYFEKLNLLQKLEIYLLIVIFYGTILYFYDEIIFNFKVPNPIKESQLIIYKNNLDIIDKKISIKNKISIVNLIDKNNAKYKIKIESLNIQENKISLKFYGIFIDMINILNFYQTHFIITYYKLENINGILHCDLKIDTKYFFNENLKIKFNKNLPNPFFYKKIKKLDYVKPKKVLKLYAIVLNEVLINGIWYKQEDIIHDNKIIKINTNSIELLNIKKNIKFKLKVHSE
jgi:hypothetical protein